MSRPGAGVGTVPELLAVVRRQAVDTADLYAELADAFAVSNNPDTASAFHDLAEGGRSHAAGLPAPTADPPRLPAWGDDYPEIADADAVHYLMPPWHAFDLAQRHETRVLALIEAEAAGAPDPDLRAVAADLARRQRDRLAAILARRDATPKPPPGWWDDPDGPNWDSEF